MRQVATSSKRTAWWSQVLTIAWLWWVYDAVSNLTRTRREHALINGRWILRFEHAAHFDVERALSGWTDKHRGIAIVVADFYDLAHLGVTFIALVALWWIAAPAYRRQRNVLVLVNVVGFLVFLVLPVAPPRMLPGFVDVISQSHAIGSWHSGALGTVANEYAAMPSLHVAWAIWCAWALSTTCPFRWVRRACVAHVLLTSIAVLATANHYVLDVVAGASTFAVCKITIERLAPILWRRTGPPLCRNRLIRSH